jgi:uncharacterized iron-regulated membrane protein
MEQYHGWVLVALGALSTLAILGYYLWWRRQPDAG